MMCLWEVGAFIRFTEPEPNRVANRSDVWKPTTPGALSGTTMRVFLALEVQLNGWI